MQNSRPQKRELFQLVNRIFDVSVNYDVLMSSHVNIVLLRTFEFAKNKNSELFQMKCSNVYISRMKFWIEKQKVCVSAANKERLKFLTLFLHHCGKIGKINSSFSPKNLDVFPAVALQIQRLFPCSFTAR